MTDYEKEQLKGCINLYFNSIAQYDPKIKKWYSPFRPKERTASVGINKNNEFTDFGTGEHGDIFIAYALYNKLDVKKDFMQIAEALAKQFNISLSETKNKNVAIPKDPKQQLAQHGLTLEEQEPQKNYTEDYKEWHKALAESEEAKAYCKKRYITDEQIEKYNIGYNKKKNKIVIPCTENYFKERSIDDNIEEKYKHNTESGLHNTIWLSDKLKDSKLNELKDFNKNDIIYIFESITDALMAEKEQVACIALNGTGQKGQAIDLLKQKDYKNKVVLMLDNDDGGRTATEWLSTELYQMNLRHIDYNDPNTQKYILEFSGRIEQADEIEKETKAITEYMKGDTKDDKLKECYKEIYSGQKDLNEYVIKSTIKDENGNINNNASVSGILIDINMYFNADYDIKISQKKFLEKIEESSSMYLSNKFFDNIENQNLYEPIKTNIDKLDNALSGGLYVKQLVVLVAETSLGKTAFALQLADTIAETQPVIYFSLEMNRDELIARSLSRTLYKKIYMLDFDGLNYNLTALDILKRKYKNTEIKKFFNEAVAEYKNNVKDNLFFFECTSSEESKIESIKKRTLDFINYTGQKPVVFIDYLQFIESGLTHGTDKQDIDFIIKELKNLARQQAINIFLISSTSRIYYGKQLDIGASKESGNIEYTADVLIGLDLQAKADDSIYNTDGNTTKKGKDTLKAERAKNPRKIKLSILKNRNGRRDIDINNIIYDARYNLYDFKNAELND